MNSLNHAMNATQATQAVQAIGQRAVQWMTQTSFSASVLVVALCAAWPLLSNAQSAAKAAAQNAPQNAPQNASQNASSRVTEIEVSNGVRKPDVSAAAGTFNRLKVGTVVEFDKRTRNVGDAMNFLLAPVRYRVTNRTVDAAAAGSVMRRPVPVAAMDAGVMSIESALLLLIGEENRLVVDHRNRLVAVERTPPGAASQPVAGLFGGNAGSAKAGSANALLNPAAQGPGVWAGAGSWAGVAGVRPNSAPAAPGAAKPSTGKDCG